MKAKVHITLKNGVLDPQGAATESALSHLGFDGVGVRVGKYVELALPAGVSKTEAQNAVEQMCQKLLANTVVEKYAIELVE